MQLCGATHRKDKPQCTPNQWDSHTDGPHPSHAVFGASRIKSVVARSTIRSPGNPRIGWQARSGATAHINVVRRGSAGDGDERRNGSVSAQAMPACHGEVRFPWAAGWVGIEPRSSTTTESV